jgi:hypothetical protein
LGNGRCDAGARVGWQGFVDVNQDERGDERWVLVVTSAGVTGCSERSDMATAHGPTAVQTRDAGRWAARSPRVAQDPLPIRRPSLYLKKSFIGTGVVGSTPGHPGAICRASRRPAVLSTVEVAGIFGVSWGLAWATFERHGRPADDDPRRPCGVRGIGPDGLLATGSGVIRSSPLAEIDGRAGWTWWRTAAVPRSRGAARSALATSVTASRHPPSTPTTAASRPTPVSAPSDGRRRRLPLGRARRSHGTGSITPVGPPEWWCLGPPRPHHQGGLTRSSGAEVPRECGRRPSPGVTSN